MKMIFVFVVLLGIVVAAPIFIRWLMRQLNIEDSAPGPAARLPYKARDFLLTRAELHFLPTLDAAAGEGHRVFAKVRLADLVWMPKGTEKRQSHQNRINMKHVDFVICERTTLKPRVVVELDDASHGREDRKERDKFVDRALAAAGLPIVHVRAAQSYSVEEVVGKLREAVGGQQPTDPDPSRRAAALN